MARTVYWASLNFFPERNWDIVVSEPNNLYKEFAQSHDKKSDFVKCPAVKDLISNTFVWRTSLKCDAVYNNEISNFVSRDLENPGMSASEYRPQAKSGDHFVTLGMPIIFFAEASLVVRLTSPYFSYASHLSHASIAPGKFDIGRWFRQINFEFQLWNNGESLLIEENEPVAYTEFESEEKIVLKRFYMNDTLSKINETTSNSALWWKGHTLKDRYELFRKARMRDLVLKQIKENLY